MPILRVDLTLPVTTLSPAPVVAPVEQQGQKESVERAVKVEVEEPEEKEEPEVTEGEPRERLAERD